MRWCRTTIVKIEFDKHVGEPLEPRQPGDLRGVGSVVVRRIDILTVLERVVPKVFAHKQLRTWLPTDT